MNGTEDYGYKRECLSYEKRFSGHISVVHYTQYYCTFCEWVPAKTASEDILQVNPFVSSIGGEAQ
ncbi:hypothetical protein T08_16009 [Trichinella sp. T8]|nr:hypothetical protein T08_16009 [Trichinella sp. T8]